MQLPLHQLFGLREELRVGPLEILDPPMLEVPDSGGHLVDHIMIVSHQQQGAGIPLQRDVEGIDGFQIQMVGRLVQNQEVGFLQHQAAENDSSRSEEHTSELQSPDHLVCRLLLEKKKKNTLTHPQLRSSRTGIPEEAKASCS